MYTNEDYLAEKNAMAKQEKMIQESWLSKAFAGLSGALEQGGKEIGALATKVAKPVTDAKNKIVDAYTTAAKKEEDKNKKAVLEKLRDEEALTIAKGLYKDFSKQLAKMLTKAGFTEEEAMTHIASQSAMWQKAASPE